LDASEFDSTSGTRQHVHIVVHHTQRSNMKIKLLLSASLLALCGAASAQTAVQITDPARIAEIERHAQQLGAQPMGSQAMGAPMAGEGGERMHRGDRMHRKHMRAHRKHMREMRHHNRMQGNRAAMRPQPDMAAPPPAPPGQN
jgi:uncharacterized cupredoxin-like copper-binding protein